jgi:hypothetical protein
LKKK